MVQLLWKTVWRFLKKSDMIQEFYFRYIAKRIKNRVSKKYLYIHVHSSIFTIVKMWEQPCP